MRADNDRPELDADCAIRIGEGGCIMVMFSDDEKLDTSFGYAMFASDPPQVAIPHRLH